MLTLKYTLKSVGISSERVPWDNERVPESSFYRGSLCRKEKYSEEKVDVSSQLEQLEKQLKCKI